MKKYKIIIVALVVVVLIPVGILAAKVIAENLSAEAIDDTVSLETEYTEPIANNFDCDVMVYGKNLGFDPILKVRDLTEITEETLADSTADHEFLIVNNNDGSIVLTEKEQKLIQQFIDENGYNFFYIGANAEKLMFDFDADACFNYIVYKDGYAWGGSDSDYDNQVMKEDTSFGWVRNNCVILQITMILEHYKEPVAID